MTQYIDKAAILAEIERLVDNIEYHEGYDCGYRDGRNDILEILKDTIDTLEVKEVDLEEEIDNVWNPHFNLGWDNNSLISINHKSFESIAKYFFELGLKSQQNINIDMTTIDEIIEEGDVDPNSKEAKIFKESYYTALEKLKVQKGE